MDRRSFFRSLGFGVPAAAAVIAAPVPVAAKFLTPESPTIALPGKAPTSVMDPYDPYVIPEMAAEIAWKWLTQQLEGTPVYFHNCYANAEAIVNIPFVQANGRLGNRITVLDKHLEVSVLLRAAYDDHGRALLDRASLYPYLVPGCLALVEQVQRDSRSGRIVMAKLPQTIPGTGVISATHGHARAILGYCPARLQQLLTLDVLYGVEKA